MNRLILSLLALLVSASLAFGQKVKYKDLFILLNGRQFDQAEPFLKKYLKDNDDNPNAYLFMGQIYQEKSLKSDVLKESDKVKQMADSAVFFYDKAVKGITEKEIKKNDDYYQQYSRRDLRTGEFGIKLSDVQLDLDKRISSLKERGTRVLLAASQFKDVQGSYQATVTSFQGLQTSFAGAKQLLLQSDEKTLVRLTGIGKKYDSTLELFSSFKATMALLGKTGYNQTLTPVELVNFKDDVGPAPDFYADEIKIKDFKKWSATTVEVIERDVVPLRKELISFDVEINKLGEKLKRDSVSVTAELGGVEKKLSINPVAKFDNSPMPLEVFKMKIAELKYGSLRVVNRKRRDSTNLMVRMQALQGEWKAISQVDSISGLLLERNLEDDAVNYQHFVTNAYGTTTVLKSLIKATHEYAIVEKVKREAQVSKIKSSLNWLLVEADSIPLVIGLTSNAMAHPLLVSDLLTIGLTFEQDSLATGYLYSVTPSRIPDVRAKFPVDQGAFVKRNLPVVKALSKADPNGQLFFALVYSETKVAEKFPVTIAKVYKTDGLAWASNLSLEYLPSELIINTTSGELSIKTTSPAGDSKIVIVDKNGKLIP